MSQVIPNSAALANLGIGSAALHALSPIEPPVVAAEHPAIMAAAADPDSVDAAVLAGSVVDPEIPVLTLADLGVLRRVAVTGDTVRVTITPTYSGCPAMDAMAADIEQVLTAAGYREVTVERRLAPAWTTDDISAQGREVLQRYGIAPPHQGGRSPVALSLSIRCPHCGSPSTSEISRFGATSCKSLHRCAACAEPFEHFKVLT